MKDFFYGWYFKTQTDNQTLAVIPAVHSNGHKKTCSIQLITEDGVWVVPFPGRMFHKTEGTIRIGRNLFCRRGFRIEINTPELTAKGKVIFGALFPLKYDIMGPFALLPFMECRHSVWSMRHLVTGSITINGKEYNFHNATGYWEGDCGYSFPKEYLWTHCFFPEGSLMLSVADVPIPMTKKHLTGIIGIVLWRGKEYRFATYLGAKVVDIRDKKVCVTQGKYRLEAQLLETKERPLNAPVKGNMSRTIHESVACRAHYQLKKNGRTIFSFATDKASFEYEYERSH